MAKAVCNLEIKATPKQISQVILNPHLFNIRGYLKYESISDNSWIEDYGNNVIYQLCFKKINKNEIIIEQFEIAKSARSLQTYSYLFEEIDPKHTSVTIKSNYKKANIFTRTIKLINDHNPGLQTYSFQLDKIAAFIKQAKALK